MTSLELTRRALLDIQEVENYSIETWGESVACDYLQSIEDAFMLLKANPGLLRPKRKWSDALCFYRVREHFLVCAKFESTIVVLNVAHGSMDLPTRISELEPQLLQEAEMLYRASLKK